MNQKHWAMIALLVLVVVVVFTHQRDPSSPMSEESSTAPPTQSEPDQKQPKAPPKPREPASQFASQQEPAIAPAVLPAARERLAGFRPMNPRAVRRQVAQSLSPYRSSEQLTLPSGSFEVLKLRAIPKGDYTTEQGEPVAQRLGHIFVATPDSALASSRPVVMNKASGLLGIVTGTLLVRVDNPSSAQMTAQTLSRALSLRVLYVDESIGLIYFAANPDSASQILNSIKGAATVTSATLEIIETEERI